PFLERLEHDGGVFSSPEQGDALDHLVFQIASHRSPAWHRALHHVGDVADANRNTAARYDQSSADVGGLLQRTEPAHDELLVAYPDVAAPGIAAGGFDGTKHLADRDVEIGQAHRIDAHGILSFEAAEGDDI